MIGHWVEILVVIGFFKAALQKAESRVPGLCVWGGVGQEHGSVAKEGKAGCAEASSLLQVRPLVILRLLWQ